jgi:outer membrane cobalamin receptor
MNKSLYPLAVGLLSAFGVFAAEPQAAAPPNDAEIKTEEQANCLQQTGSRIQRSEEQPCVSAPGQVITRDQIERTGAVTVSDAIRRSSAAAN